MNGTCRSMIFQLSLVVSVVVSTARGDDRINFARDIRPILSNACFQCHGPDASQRKADLRLDLREGAVGDGKAPGVLVPGQPVESEFWRRIVAEDPDIKMPPPKSGKHLSDSQIALIRRWIEQGAEWNRHWAFDPPQRPLLPGVSDKNWIKTPIDAFVLSRLDREGLAPSAPAEKESLLRRVSLDLTGLPPTVAEVEAFLADKNPQAYAAVVEKLLESPHYGERWGRIWLDAARYADSDGYEKDKSRFVWAYRDWVIGAFNKNLPYDQFIIQQIAGDLLPGGGPEEWVATGFLRNSMINEEGGVDPEQFRMEAMFDRMDAIGKGILGLTIQCGQCHNHKYDPLTQEEYYRMFAFLNNSHEASIPVYTPAEWQQRAAILKEITDIEDSLRAQHTGWKQQLEQWEESARGNQVEWSVIQSAEDDVSGGQKMYRLKDGSYLCQGYAPTKHDVSVTAKTNLQNITALRLEQLNDPNLPLHGPGRSIKGTSALTEFKVKVQPVGKPDQAAWLKFVKASADINPAEKPLEKIYDDKSGKNRVTGPIAFAIDGKDETAWSIDPGPGRRNQACHAVFVPEAPFGFPEGTEIEVHLVQNHGGWNSDDNQNHNLGRFRLSVTTATDPTSDPLPVPVRANLALPREARSAAQNAELFSYWRTTVPEFREANAKIEQLWSQHPEGSSQLVLEERHDVRPTHLLMRGDFLKPAGAVVPGVPAFLHPLPKNATLDRLSFARWLVDRNSPTTARSFVNRVWQSIFGTGLVATPEELGSQSEMPSHAELLDWLAVEFMEPGTSAATTSNSANDALPRWNIKHLQRLIVTSATYRQSSKIRPELLSRDPANRLLARGPRFRVDAEVVRDVALAASGLLDRSVGGASVFPPAPDFLFLPPASYGPKTWATSAGSAQFRRAMYTFRYRSVPYPALQAFDAPNGDFACVRRSRSNTPLQALTSLNEPVFLECARQLARNILLEKDASDAARMQNAFRRCVARMPNDHELKTLLALLEKEKQRFSDGKHNPWELVAADPEHPPELPAGATPGECAAWTVVARVLLNLDETITKE